MHDCGATDSCRQSDLKRSTKADKVKKERDSLSIEMGSFDVDHALFIEREYFAH